MERDRRVTLAVNTSSYAWVRLQVSEVEDKELAQREGVKVIVFTSVLMLNVRGECEEGRVCVVGFSGRHPLAIRRLRL